jgi:hypothetical protein
MFEIVKLLTICNGNDSPLHIGKLDVKSCFDFFAKLDLEDMM